MKNVALGIRMHSGWGVVVAIDEKHEVVDRRRIILVDERTPGGKMPFHHAEKMALPAADKFLTNYTAECDHQARHELEKAHQELSASGYHVIVVALVLASGRPLPELQQILASHALIHAAEGELFRDSAHRACQALGRRVIGYRERDLPGRIRTNFGRSADSLISSVNHAGKTLGPPWTGDYEAAAFAACLALRECGRELRKASTAQGEHCVNRISVILRENPLYRSKRTLALTNGWLAQAWRLLGRSIGPRKGSRCAIPRRLSQRNSPVQALAR